MYRLILLELLNNKIHELHILSVVYISKIMYIYIFMIY